MSISIPRHEVTVLQEASIYFNLVEDEKAFARGFVQTTDTIVPALPEGDLIEVANEFTENDRARFEHVDGMAEIFDTDSYKLGVVMGIFASRQRARILRSERQEQP